jgi:hypothetical protein
LQALYQAAKTPTLSTLVRLGSNQRPQISISDSTINGWLNRKTVPTGHNTRYLLAMVEFLQDKARRSTPGYKPLQRGMWEQLLREAQKERAAGKQQGRPRRSADDVLDPPPAPSEAEGIPPDHPVTSVGVTGLGDRIHEQLEGEHSPAEVVQDPSASEPDPADYRTIKRKKIIALTAAIAAVVVVVAAIIVSQLPPPRECSLAGSYARAVRASQPSAYWQFSNANSSGYADCSGHGNTLPPGSTTLVRPRDGSPAGAIATAGHGTHTPSPLSPLEGDAPRTVEAWFRSPSGGCILTAGYPEHTGVFSLSLRPGPPDSPTPGRPGFYFSTWDADIFVPIAGLEDGHWHYAAVTLRGKTVNIVIDGNQPQAYIWNGGTYGRRVPQPLILPYTPDTIPTAVGVGSNCIGGGDVPTGLVGAIAEVAVYPRGLSVLELHRHYQLLANRDALPRA